MLNLQDLAGIAVAQQQVQHAPGAGRGRGGRLERGVDGRLGRGVGGRLGRGVGRGRGRGGALAVLRARARHMNARRSRQNFIKKKRRRTTGLNLLSGRQWHPMLLAVTEPWTTCCPCSRWTKAGPSQKGGGLGSSGRLRRC